MMESGSRKLQLRRSRKQILEDLLSIFSQRATFLCRTGLGLTQTSGFTIVADKLNYMVGKTSSCQNNVLSINRCKSHSASFSADPTSCVTFHTFDQFTAVLVSQSFEQQLFGNYCQSHGASMPCASSDGSPCGLLNHLAASCYIHVACESTGEARDRARSQVLRVLSSAGALILHGSTNFGSAPPAHLTVMLDGLILGFVADSDAKVVVSALRAARFLGQMGYLHILRLRTYHCLLVAMVEHFLGYIYFQHLHA